MTPVSVAFKTKSELLRERAQLISSSKLSLEELRGRAASYDLTVEQRDILEEIENLEFLLADD